MDNYYLDRQDEPFINDKYRIFRHQERPWIDMIPLEYDKFKEAGWKFHLSVDGGDVAKAWNIIVDEMMNDKKVMHVAKAAPADVAARMSDPNYPQAGKMITLYTDINVPSAHYEQFLERVEARFKVAGIRPGPSVNGDRKVPGGTYTFYRNGLDLTGEYNAAAGNKKVPKKWQYNPFKVKDVYEKFLIRTSHVAAPPMSMRKVAKWDWQAAKAGNVPIWRLPVADDAAARAAINDLKYLGMDGRARKIPDLGLTVSIWGKDLEAVERERQKPAQQVKRPPPSHPKSPG